MAHAKRRGDHPITQCQLHVQACMYARDTKSLGTLIALFSTKKLQENVQDSVLEVAAQEQR